MKKIMLGICCALLVALAVSGFWATRAVNQSEADQVIDPAGTSLAVNLTNKEMTRQADLIAIGQCVDTRSRWIDRDLVTEATISVSEVLKGEADSTVTVILPGGIDANRKIPIAMTYPGAPQIAPQEEVFLFLTRAEESTGGYAIMGFSQGKFSIVDDGEGGKVVSRDLTRVRLRDKSGLTRGGKKVTPLSRFKEEIKGYLR